LNLEALQKALYAVIARHEILRTTYTMCGDAPIQAVSAERPCEFTVTDLRSIPLSERDAQLKDLLRREAGRPFNLAADLMLRANVLNLNSAENILLLVMHHIATDGWSLGVLCREISALYEAYDSNRSSSLPELSIQYRDFAAWQRKHLDGERLTGDLAYWKKQLNGVPASLELPTDYSRPAAQSYRGATQSFVISRVVADQLKALSRREGLTFFMTLLAAFQTLLCRYSGQEDVVVGSPVAGRSREETKPLVGCFINNIVLRTDLSGNPTFTELSARVRDVALGAYEHQELPFEKLVEELHPERNRSRHPLFQVMFELDQLSTEAMRLPGIKVERLDVQNDTAKFDLKLYMVEEQDGLKGLLEYSTDLFEHATISRMVGNFRTLLEGIVANPNRRVSELPLLTEAERHQLLVEWNDTRREYPKDKCIHELVEAQAARTPDAVAVIVPSTSSGDDEGQQLTYRQLNDRAEQLAGNLRSMGVRPGAVVGICMERSVDLVVGLLGILKAGGAYVPIDPGYPAERIEFMIEDSAMTVLLTERRSRETWLCRAQRVRVVSVEELSFTHAVLAEHGGEKPRPDDLAYVIYTSGSTGKPKGVEIQHRALVNFLHSMRQRPGLTPQDVLLSVTTISFDIGALELFLPLIVGARVVVVSREAAVDGLRLIEDLEQCGATAMQATPATWRMLLEAGWSGNKSLKLLCGGEALSPDLAKALVSRSGSVWNLYGPTETTVWSTIWKVEPGSERILIGRPIDNTRAYVLDSRLQPVPVGVAGELYLGGDGLARGYRNRPEITAERFVDDPFNAGDRSRLYKTGDLARYLSDGNIEYLGRIDYQVKIRGYRIELGEIESALCQHEAVQHAVVVAREDEQGDGCSALGADKRLVAYAVLKDGAEATIARLRDFLKSKLPEYMIPSGFVFLDTLPLTPNGKIDRKALPEPASSASTVTETFVPPRTITEKTLAGVWAEVLNVEHIGTNSNFFDLGGHSLLLARVHRKLQGIFDREVSLVDLFEYPTISALAQYISREAKQYDRIEQPDVLGAKLKEGKNRIAELHRRRQGGAN
jgi:amino acid adenylation domain-containing protein